MRTAVDLWNVSENFSAEIVKNMNVVKKMLKEVSFHSMKFKELLAEEGTGGGAAC
jgi:hypothetical protein